jgi:serine phosphatase RsbU (regulator of sigma subunit)/predicted transcriptional regulator
MIKKEVRTILRHQWSVSETEKCGSLIAALRKEEDVMVVPVFDVNNKPIGLIDRQSVFAIASNPLHFSVYQNRTAKMLLQESFPSFDASTSIDEACEHILKLGLSLSTGGFLITEKDQYLGVGINTDMLNYLVEANHSRAEALAELNTEMMDSLNYAGRIQGALLPDMSLLHRDLQSVGVLWEPRDIVGGDVYWRTPEDHDGCFTLALIDCTGHGVPGSLMSMLVVTSLNRVYAEEPNIQPGEALARLGNLVRRSLNQDRDDCKSNDGFDAGMCKIDMQKGSITFAGARTNCFVIPQSNDPVIRLPGEKLALGYPGKQDYVKLEEFEISMDKCSTFFMASDGVLDQPGGVNSVAFGPRRLMSSIEQYRHLGAEGLVREMKHAIDLWRGVEMRRDDVSALAFTV